MEWEEAIDSSRSPGVKANTLLANAALAALHRVFLYGSQDIIVMAEEAYFAATYWEESKLQNRTHEAQLEMMSDSVKKGKAVMEKMREDLSIPGRSGDFFFPQDLNFV